MDDIRADRTDEDPFADGWRTGTSKPGAVSPWKWKDGILQQEGKYPKELNTFVEMPLIDVGNWSDVHVQYRRKLAVEDSQFDKARITVNGAQAFINATAGRGDSSAAHHIDRERDEPVAQMREVLASCGVLRA